MAYRAVFGVGLAAGYVLGARAGRERYETLVRTFRSMKEQPAVQGAAGIVAAQAGTLASRARSVINRDDESHTGEAAPTLSTVPSLNGHGAHSPS